MDFSLVMKLTDGTERKFPLKESRTLIGRETRCHVRIALPNVAEKHCEIVLDNGELQLSDLGSELGTLVNGSPVRNAVLGDADELTVGPVTFHVQRHSITARDREPASASDVNTADTPSDHDVHQPKPTSRSEIKLKAKSSDLLDQNARSGDVSPSTSARRDRT